MALKSFLKLFLSRKFSKAIEVLGKILCHHALTPLLLDLAGYVVYLKRPRECPGSFSRVIDHLVSLTFFTEAKFNTN